MGRHTAPAQTKVLTGNFRKDRDTHGAKVEIELPICPAWLPLAAKKHWSKLGPQLVEAGLISIIDGDVFALHCDTMAKYAEVTKKLKHIEDAIDKTPQQYLVQSVLFTIRSKLHEQLISTARQFGLTPAARSGIKSGGQKQLPLGGDGWDQV